MIHKSQKSTIWISILVAILLLSATVPLSVSGQAASGDRDIRTDLMNTGNTTTVVVTVQTGENGFSGIIEDRFSGSIADATVEVANTAGGMQVVAIADETGSTVGIENADPNSEITIEYTITAAANEGTIVIEDASSTNVSMGQDRIVVSNTGSTQAGTDSDYNDTQSNDTVTDGISEENNISDQPSSESNGTNESDAASQSNTDTELPGFGMVLPVLTIIMFLWLSVRE